MRFRAAQGLEVGIQLLFIPPWETPGKFMEGKEIRDREGRWTHQLGIGTETTDCVYSRVNCCLVGRYFLLQDYPV